MTVSVPVQCVNPKCPYYLKNLRKVGKEDLTTDYGKDKYKLHYIYREFTIDFFRMDLNRLPKNASSLRFSKFDILKPLTVLRFRARGKQSSQPLNDLPLTAGFH
jgi:hypothetical protein